MVKMCSYCSEFQKKMWSFGCSTFIILLAIVIGLLWPTISSKVLRNKLVLRNGSTNYENWIKTPIPMYLEIYLFNWTNPHEIHNFETIKPNFVQMGPYTFREVHERVNLIWNDNDTVTFNQKRTWTFEPDLSNGALEDRVTNLNVITSTAAYFMRDAGAISKFGLNLLLEVEGSFLWTKTVRELLFKGFDDKLLDLLKTLNGTAKVDIPFDQFGWFYNRNESETYDGTFTMDTGNDSLTKTGILTLWNGTNNTKIYPGECGMVQGTTGELWPVLKGNVSHVSIFATDICRPIKLKYESKMSKFGVVGSKYVGDDSVFDNGIKYPEASCWCTSEPSKCPDLMAGVFNVSSCKFNSPTFVSFPHFYLADSSYLESLTGLHPNKSLHEFFIALEPNTGIPLEVQAQLQINQLLQPIQGLKFFEHVPKMMVPMLWFNQRASLTATLADQAKMALMLPYLGIYISVIMAIIGVISVGVSVYFSLKKWSSSLPYEELLR